MFCRLRKNSYFCGNKDKRVIYIKCFNSVYYLFGCPENLRNFLEIEKKRISRVNVCADLA